jgi:hypothetical protein
MRQQEVLDNLARTAADAGAQPYFAVFEKGTTQVSDTANPSGSLTWDPHSLTSEMLSLGGSRALTDEWDVSPVTDPDKLHAMHCAYLWALGQTDSGGECADLLHLFQVDTELAKIHPGWFAIGKRCDVPKHACRVAHCGSTYVWVMPGGSEELTRFTLTIMDIATVDKSGLGPKTQTVERYEYLPDGKLHKKITYTENFKPEATAAGADVITLPTPTLQLKPREPRGILPSGILVTPPTAAPVPPPVVVPRTR